MKRTCTLMIVTALAALGLGGCNGGRESDDLVVTVAPEEVQDSFREFTEALVAKVVPGTTDFDSIISLTDASTFQGRSYGTCELRLSRRMYLLDFELTGEGWQFRKAQMRDYEGDLHDVDAETADKFADAAGAVDQSPEEQ